MVYAFSLYKTKKLCVYMSEKSNRKGEKEVMNYDIKYYCTNVSWEKILT